MSADIKASLCGICIRVQLREQLLQKKEAQRHDGTFKRYLIYQHHTPEFPSILGPNKAFLCFSGPSKGFIFYFFCSGSSGVVRVPVRRPQDED